MDTESDIDLALTTDSKVVMQDGSASKAEIPDHGPPKSAMVRQFAITERGGKLVRNYRDDARDARVVAAAPPSMRELIDQLWHSPQVLADSGLLRFAVRIYSLVAIPFVAVLYLLIAAHVKPALAVVVDAILIFLIWMWISS